MVQMREPIVGTREQQAFDFTKSLYASIGDWYKDVQVRAQAVVTLDGAFITILTAVLVGKGSDVSAIKANFAADTTVAVVTMGGMFILSGACAILALMPLGLRTQAIERKYKALKKGDESDPAPSVMWWSQFIQQQGREEFLDASAKMTASLHQRALASQIHELSERLRRKYQLVFAAFVFTGLGLLALVYAAASYFYHVPSVV
jgi:hypothetical protein